MFFKLLITDPTNIYGVLTKCQAMRNWKCSREHEEHGLGPHSADLGIDIQIEIRALMGQPGMLWEVSRSWDRLLGRLWEQYVTFDACCLGE